MAYLRQEILTDLKNLEKIRAKIQKDPQRWWVGYHHGWGTNIRNMLREGGHGEKELEVANLDDVYIGLVEEAVYG